MELLGIARDKRVVGYGWFAGVVLMVIGVRFLVWPQSASSSFGLGDGGSEFGLQYVIGLRDIWLGFLLISFAWLRSFGPLSLWFLLGAGVCFGDAAIVSIYAGPAPAIVFHVLSGIYCSLAGLAAGFEAKSA